MKRATIKRRKRAPNANVRLSFSATARPLLAHALGLCIQPASENGQQGAEDDSFESGSPAPAAKKGRKKRKDTPSHTSAGSPESGIDALLSASGTGASKPQPQDAPGASPSGQNMTLPELALVASRMAREEERDTGDTNMTPAQSDTGGRAPLPSASSAPSGPVAPADTLPGSSAPQHQQQQPPGHHHHHPHPHLHHHHYHHAHVHPSRQPSAALPSPNALPSNAEDLKTFRKNLSAQISATHEHIRALQAFSSRAELLLGSVDDKLAAPAPSQPDTAVSPAPTSGVNAPPLPVQQVVQTAAPAALATAESDRSADGQEQTPIRQQVSVSSSSDRRLPITSVTKVEETPESFHARLAALPVQSAVPLKKRPVNADSTA